MDNWKNCINKIEQALLKYEGKDDSRNSTK